MNLEHLIKALEMDADDAFDGHFTIMKFTTGWKVVMGTPDVTEEYKDFLGNVPIKKDIRSALVSTITADARNVE